MKLETRIGAVALSLVAASAFAAEPPGDDAQRMQEAKQLMQRFGGTLKGELQAAMKADGPVGAIKVCNTRAPEIAAALSAESGWTIGRTSLKRRSPANEADAWEQGVLEDFARRKAAGEKPDTLVHKAIVDVDGTRTFRVMKAIPTGEPCTTCHGVDIKPAIKAELDRLYPDDKARGFSVGDLRGAFTLSKPL